MNAHKPTQFEQLLHEIDDAVVEFEIVDREERSSSGSRTQSGDGEPVIVDANHAFRDIFSPDMKRVIGLRLNDLIVPATKQAEAKQFDQRTSDGRSNVAFVERTTTEGNRTFLYRGIPYDDDHGFAIYTDVTGELQQQDELTEIIALAEQLRSNPAEIDTVDVATEIKAKAETLVQFTG
jgi:PAS domain-containing protein